MTDTASTRTVLVTGSSRGIGRAVALSLADAGYDVVVHCLASRAQAEEVCREIEAKGRNARLLTFDVTDREAARETLAADCEAWLCAGQSNMYWPLARCAGANEEAAATAKHDIRLWDFVSGRWRRLTPANAKQWSAIAVSFAIRRAKATGKPIAILLVDVGGAPTEAFLPAPVMAAVDAKGAPRYPRLLRILTNRKPLNQNEDFPYSWVKAVYGKGDRAWRGWAPGVLWDKGLARVRHLPLTGILWYQGESNASIAMGPDDKPLDGPYMEETLRAIVATLQGLAGKQAPVLMVGLPVLNRPWDRYRALQKQVCAETGAIYLDTFSRGLGDTRNVHPAEKRPFADMASAAASAALGK